MTALRLPLPSTTPSAPTPSEPAPSEPTEHPPQLAVLFDRPQKPRDDSLVVLYCHGFASTQSGEKADYFRRRFLDAGIAFCSFDFRGHGESSGEITDISMSRNLEDVGAVHAFLKEQGFTRLLLFGSSMGGAVSSWYASLHPEAVAGAIFIAPGLEMADGLLRSVGPDKAAAWREEGRILFEHELGGYWLSWQLIEDLRAYSRFRLARTYRTPTLIFQGMQDQTVDWRSVVDFADGSEAAVTVSLYSDGDHRLLGRLPAMWRQAEIFLGEIGVFDAPPSDLKED